mmetsp:Transcript_69458/g.219802  ORF Transcript_69458/g.219802 Transcript_69458/m.219802 type:complete len:149 (-) Transcript_69458:35-481(-)
MPHPSPGGEPRAGGLAHGPHRDGGCCCALQKYKIRVMDADKFKATEQLRDNCEEFVQKIEQLTGVVKDVMGQVDTHASKIDEMKLRAVGQRNRSVTEEDTRKRLEMERKTLLSEKQEELERLNAELQSLVKVKAEQDALIAKLSDSGA